MPKIRKPASIEKGLEEVIQILTEDEIVNSIGKSSSYLRKCSDPEQNYWINHDEFFKLDQACIKKNKAPPLLDVYEYMVSKEMGSIDFGKIESLDEVLVRFNILHGKLIEKIKEAQDPKSDKGSEISDIEKKDILKAVRDLENKILKVKTIIDK